MTDVMVQVRMPKQLLDDVKKDPDLGHYLDLSEFIRSLVRDAWIQQAKPELFEIKKLREDITTELQKQSAAKVKQEMIAELEKIRDLIKKEGTK